MIPRFSCPRISNGLTFTYEGEYDVCAARSGVVDTAEQSALRSGISTSTHSPEEFRKSEYHRKLQEHQAKGTWPQGCNWCLDSELAGKRSIRMDLLSQADQGRYLHLNASNVCDSDCIMCGPKWSTKVAARLRMHPDPEHAYVDSPIRGIRDIWSNPASVDNLRLAAAESDWINIVGGEPMIDPQLWKFLAEIARPDLSISFVTNMSTFPNDSQLLTLAGFKQTQMHVSIDATELTYEWIRHGLDWNVLIQNLVRLKNRNIYFTVHCEIQAHSVANIPDHHRFFSPVSHVSYHAVSVPTLLRPRNAPLWALENSISKLIDNKADQQLINIMQEEFKLHDPSIGARLAKHTEYLNAHRRHKFNVSTWKVEPR